MKCSLKYCRDIWKAIGNVCDRWDMLANDIKSDPGCNDLSCAIGKLRDVIDSGGPCVDGDAIQA